MKTGVSDFFSELDGIDVALMIAGGFAAYAMLSGDWVTLLLLGGACFLGYAFWLKWIAPELGEAQGAAS